MRFLAVSDTHNQPIPRIRGDVLIHAGDLTVRGTEKELVAAAEELAGYPCRRILIIPGNHDILFETDPAKARQIFEDRQIQVLINQATEAGGMKIWGSPYVQKCWGAFGYDGTETFHPWNLIPEDTEILITHGPMKYMLDQGPNGTHLGCSALASRIQVVKPLYHVHGHIHCAYGQQTYQDTTHINAAICSERYDVLNPPIVFHCGLPGDYERW